MATLKGTWRFNDVLTKASFYNEVYFDFQTVAIINGESYKLYCNTIYQDVNEPYDSASLQYIAVSSIPDLSELGISFPLGSYVYDGSTKEWRTDLYGEGIQTITFTEEQEVSDEFYAWFTANAVGVIETPTADSVKAKIQSLIAKANSTTGKSDEDLTSGVNSLIEGYGQGGGNIVPLTVGANGTFDADSPVIVTETFTGEGEPDVIYNDGIDIPMFKAKKLVATSGVMGAIQTGQVCYEMGGEKVTLSINDVDVDDSYFAMWYSLGVPLCVWVMTPGKFMFKEEQGFEPNSFYIADFWTLMGYEKGTPIAITSLGKSDKPIDGYMPVEVSLPLVEELRITPKYGVIQTISDGNYYRNIEVYDPKTRSITIKPTMSKQVISLTAAEMDEMGAYSLITVEAFDLSQAKVLCDIEIETLPTKLEYRADEWLDTDGGMLLRKYTDGSSARITIVNSYVTGFKEPYDSKIPGRYKLNVTYKENGITCRTFYYITFVE